MRLTFTMAPINLNMRAFNVAELDDICERQASDLRFAITRGLDSATDHTGSPLAALSPNYALKKELSGRTPHRDLNYTGDFRRSMETRKVSTGNMFRTADIYFLGSTRGDKPITFAQLAAIQNERSPWFFISKPFQDSFVEKISTFVERAMKILVNP